MSTSYVEFREKGFWSWDRYLEDALCVIAQAPTAGADPVWLSEARQHWRRQASGVFAGWIHPQLDEFLRTEDRRQVFLQLAEVASQRDDLTPEATATLKLLIALVRGDLSTDSSSPLDYMVSGNFPYRGLRSE